MPTFTVFFNPNWPDSEHVQLGEPTSDRDEAVTRLREEVVARYGFATQPNHDGMQWSSNLHGGAMMGKRGSHNHGYIHAIYSRKETAENQIRIANEELTRLTERIAELRVTRDQWQHELDALVLNAPAAHEQGGG